MKDLNDHNQLKLSFLIYVLTMPCLSTSCVLHFQQINIPFIALAVLFFSAEHVHVHLHVNVLSFLGGGLKVSPFSFYSKTVKPLFD